MSHLFVTNEKRGVKKGESDLAFWEDLLNEPPEEFTPEELASWGKQREDKDSRRSE
jgi:hypothetical protein